MEFKKPAKPPEAGQPPFDLVVQKGGLPVPAGAAKKARRNDDDDEPKRKGGSATAAFVSGGLGLLFVFCALGATGWYLFTQVDVDTSWDKVRNAQANAGGARPSPGNAGGNAGGGRVPGTPAEPPKPKDSFELRPEGGSPPLIAVPADLDPSAPREILLSKVDLTAIGGGGRYIVLHSQGLLSVFDATTGDLRPETATMENGEVRLAAGLNKMVVSVPNTKRLRVLSLPDMKTIREFEVPGAFGVNGIAMGSRTNGPLLAIDPFGEIYLFDLNTGKPIEGAGGKQPMPGGQLRAAADGKLFVGGDGFGASHKFKTMDESQKKWRVLEPDVIAAYPSPDGKYMYAKDMIVEVSGNRFKQVAGRPKEFAAAGTKDTPVWYVPAVNATGNYFLRVNEVKGVKAGRNVVAVTLHRNRDVDRPLLPSWEGLPETENLISWGRDTEPLDRHLFVIPEAKLLVTLNRDKTKLVVRKIKI
jgi:hypothetical protein